MTLGDVQKKVLVVVGAFALGLASGWFSRPEKVVTKVETKVVDHYVNSTNTSDVNHKKIVVVETKAPDGTPVKTTTITADDTKSTTSKVTDDSTSDTKSSKVVTYDKPSWLIAVTYGVSLSGPPAYGGSVDKRILGPIYVGGYGLTSGQFGVRLGIQF